MKRLFIVLSMLFGLFAQDVFAGHGKSVVNLRYDANTPIIVWLDGYRTGPRAVNHRIEHIRSGRHQVKVVSIQRDRCGLERRRVVFNDWVRIPANQELFAVVKGYNRYFIERQFSLIRPSCGHQSCTQGFCGHQNNRPACGHSGCSISACTHGANYGHGFISMSPAEFNNLKRTISNRHFESSKLTIAKRALADNRFSARQVSALMDLFHFESSKVEIAKFAYDRTVDKQNYYVVMNRFNYGSSVDEVSDYIAMY